MATLEKSQTNFKIITLIKRKNKEILELLKAKKTNFKITRIPFYLTKTVEL